MQEVFNMQSTVRLTAVESLGTTNIIHDTLDVSHSVVLFNTRQVP